MPALLDMLYLSVVALLLSTVLLMLCGHRISHSHPASGALYLAAIVLASDALLRTAGITLPETALLAAFAPGLVVVLLAKNWNAPGQTCFYAALLCSGGYLACAVQASYAAIDDPLGLFFALLLLTLIAAVLTLMLVHAFEVIDVICRIRWRRRILPQADGSYFPKVSLHVPACREPPAMVIATLDALARLDYPDYEVIMVDDNTTDPALWRPVQEHCRKLGFRFFHLENWPGFKSGALNFALSQTAPDAEIVGIVDSDYLVDPDYLKELVGLFREPRLAFVQTPQDYRDVDPDDRYSLAMYHAYQYFFKLSMASRNERNGIIFAGTMGLIRRSAMEEAGGWNEWCITEDAELALRLLDRGHESVYVDKTYGRGLMPLDFAGLRKQRFRWAFGGMQILRMHWRKLLPFTRRRADAGRLSFGQKFDYWSGALQWLNDPITSLFTAVLIIGAGVYALTRNSLLPPIAGSMTLTPFLFIVFGMLKIPWALKLRLRCSFGEAYRAFLILLSLTWVVTLACAQGLTRRQGVFLRTPKERGQGTLIGSFRIASRETGIAALVLATILLLQWRVPQETTTLLLSGLLLWQAYIYSTALRVQRWSCARSHKPARGRRIIDLDASATSTRRRLAIALLAGALGLSGAYHASPAFAPSIDTAVLIAQDRNNQAQNNIPASTPPY